MLKPAIAFCVIALTWPLGVAAADFGRELAALCSTCHNPDPNAGGAIPPIAGLDKNYLIAQLLAFKNATRPATVMTQLAKGYTDAQIEVIASYVSAMGSSPRESRKSGESK